MLTVLATLVLAVSAVVQGPGGRRFPGTPALDPCTVSSPSGGWRLSVEPRERWSGPALHRLDRRGEVVWTRDEPWTLQNVAVTDAGRVVGWHFDSGGWRVLVIAPTGHALVDDFRRGLRSTCLGPGGPTAFRVDLLRGVVSFRFSDLPARRLVERAYALDTGAWLGDRDVVPPPGACIAGVVVAIPVDAEPFELQLLETIQLGDGRAWSVHCLDDGRLLVRRSREISVFDDRGRRRFRFESDGPLTPDVALVGRGCLELERHARGAEAILVVGPDGRLLEERPCSPQTLAAHSVQQPGGRLRWLQEREVLTLLDGEVVLRRLERFPDGTWFQTGPMSVARDGSVAVLAQPWSAAHPSLSAWDAEGEPRAMVSLPGFPDAVGDVFAFDGWRAALATADALFVVELDTGRVRRAPLPADGSATGRRVSFSPTGSELLVPRLEPPAVLVFRVP